MSVLLEFTLPSDEFVLGQVLTRGPDVRVSLERIVPTGNQVFPFFWAQIDGDFESFEERVRTHPRVKELHVLDRLDGMNLYRAVWETEPESLIAGIEEADGTVLSEVRFT